MTETEFRGLKLMMLERYRRNQGGNRDARREIRGYSITSDINNDYITGAKQEFGIREGVSPVELMDDVLKECFKKAFRDALASSLSRNGGVNDRLEECWRYLHDGLGMDAVLSLLRVRTQVEFDRAHKRLAEAICEHLQSFTFGNSQKLINMMLKYCYVLSLYWSATTIPRIKKFVEIINRLAPFMHVPIDTIMLMVLRGDVIQNEDDHALITKPTQLPTYEIKTRRGSYPWSKLPADGADGEAGYDAYMALQHACRERAEADWLSPIAWECKEWFNAR